MKYPNLYLEEIEMDPQEIRTKILSAINNIIKDNPENPEESKASMDAAQADLHDVLAAKMRDRINPPAADADPVAAVEDPPADDDDVVDLDDDDDTDPDDDLGGE